jgi:hypothetical protein
MDKVRDFEQLIRDVSEIKVELGRLIEQPKETGRIRHELTAVKMEMTRVLTAIEYLQKDLDAKQVRTDAAVAANSAALAQVKANQSSLFGKLAGVSLLSGGATVAVLKWVFGQ